MANTQLGGVPLLSAQGILNAAEIREASAARRKKILALQSDNRVLAHVAGQLCNAIDIIRENLGSTLHPSDQQALEQCAKSARLLIAERTASPQQHLIRQNYIAANSTLPEAHA